ncbi:hypothetical protein [Bosea sp. CS1GBMeth4]|uniref:hypothetical protein n=1 Tax=Bosea sp. CS1GBMeth4 TaxID=1892849 RepID=UPI001645AB5F|nr:hypothetical protein [Bosea sp. CS1GBMeth4]
MIRPLAAALLAAILLPASAEAAKLRSGGGRSHGATATQPQRDGSHAVMTPTLRSRQTQSAAATPQPLHIASPAAIAAAEASGLRRGEPAEPRIWCRSQVVVGGFCVMN